MNAITYPVAASGALYDSAQVEEYLSTLFRNVEWNDGELISLLGIGEKGTDREGQFKERQIIPPAFIGSAHEHLKRWAGWHVAGFVVPAVLHPSALAKGDVTLDKVAALTAILLDIDSGDTTAKREFVTKRLGTPSMVVASGGKTDEGTPKLHLYWLLTEASEEVDRVAALRKTLAEKCGGDPSFGRATQVVRVAGSVHSKHAKSALCSIVDRSDCEYDLDDLAEIITTMLPMEGLPAKAQLPAVPSGLMDFTPNPDTAIAAMHRDIEENGVDLTRWSEFSKVAGFNISEARAGRLTPEAAYIATNGWMLEHMNPPWPQARFDQEFRGLVNKDIANHGAFPQSVLVRAEASAATSIEPTPASWPHCSTIPPRPWLLGRWLQRGIVTAMIAPGGVGKSSLITGIGLSLSSGREILGKTVYGGPLKTWIWNLEDGGDNLARSRVAASLHHGISEASCGGRLFVDSGPEGATLCTAVEDRTGFAIIEPVMANITDAISRMGIDVLVVDPFVSSHAVNENDNNKIDAVAKRWARVAQSTNCSIVLVHHSVKLHGEAVTADSSRGAGALNNAARMTLVLNRMTADQAQHWNIEPSKARTYFNVADDKHNMAPPEAADWFELVGVSLNNATDTHEADSIGVVVRWQPPKVMDGVDVDHLFQVQRVLANGTYWRASTSKVDWAGDVVASILKIEADTLAAKARIDKMLNIWLASGALKLEVRRGDMGASGGTNRRMRECITVGNWASDPNGANALVHDTLNREDEQEQPDGR